MGSSELEKGKKGRVARERGRGIRKRKKRLRGNETRENDKILMERRKKTSVSEPMMKQ